MRPENAYRNTEVLCKAITFASYFMIAAVTTLVLVSWEIGHEYALSRLAVCAVAFMYIVATHMLLRAHYVRATSYLLTTFYLVLASGIVWTWGVNSPIGTLLFGLVIVIAGIVLSARHALIAAAISSTILLGALINGRLHIIGPVQPAAGLGDVSAYTIVFGMLALISWLYNGEIERSLARAKQADVALRKQKRNLEIAVKKRTAQLRRAQIEEMEQMYRLVELGQLGVDVLHDLSNYLTALTLEVESLENKQRSKDVARIRQIMQYLDDMVQATRNQLQGDTARQTFNLVQCINKATNFLGYKARRAQVQLDWAPPEQGEWGYVGDPVCLCRVIVTLVGNAIDAYASNNDSSTEKRKVSIRLSRVQKFVVISIYDHGKGISLTERDHIFKPFYSTKKSGLGLGLFLAKQAISTRFSGTITLTHNNAKTEFRIKIPVTHAT